MYTQRTCIHTPKSVRRDEKGCRKIIITMSWVKQTRAETACNYARVAAYRVETIDENFEIK